ncbi:MAG: redoxin domain-containing protein [Candidatus Micrarchaeota archaeon]|nr:redoxin domain-containing protein [Candidatus Micrarchaeota archaeon]
MKINIYVIVFGIIALLIIIAGISSIFFSGPGANSPNTSPINVTNLKNYGPAPNIQGISAWINSRPINLTQLKGKVVLIDFWTYSCINCIRTIPHLNAWENEYGNNGLVIIGVHTPEFQFEKNYSNVLNAVNRFGIKYPVALDNNYSTWISYNNHYWPADYLIDKNGNIRVEQAGEGDYNQTEKLIRALLVDANYSIPNQMTNVSMGVNFSEIGSPEMYFGYSEISAHGSYFSGNDMMSPESTFNYTAGNLTQPNTIYLAGQWYDGPDSMVATSNSSKIFLIYKAKNVNVVASGSGHSTSIAVKLDGESLNQSSLGSDAKVSGGEAIVNVSSSRLYNLVSTPSYGIHVLEIDARPNFRIYTFTFG